MTTFSGKSNDFSAPCLPHLIAVIFTIYGVPQWGKFSDFFMPHFIADIFFYNVVTFQVEKPNLQLLITANLVTFRQIVNRWLLLRTEVNDFFQISPFQRFLGRLSNRQTRKELLKNRSQRRPTCSPHMAACKLKLTCLHKITYDACSWSGGTKCTSLLDGDLERQSALARQGRQQCGPGRLLVLSGSRGGPLAGPGGPATCRPAGTETHFIVRPLLNADFGTFIIALVTYYLNRRKWPPFANVFFLHILKTLFIFCKQSPQSNYFFSYLLWAFFHHRRKNGNSFSLSKFQKIPYF